MKNDNLKKSAYELQTQIRSETKEIFLIDQTARLIQHQIRLRSNEELLKQQTSL